ncbi:MAG: hypothetical protein ACP5NV_01150 [Candidatus Woesearchaeota archaeon]
MQTNSTINSQSIPLAHSASEPIIPNAGKEFVKNLVFIIGILIVAIALLVFLQLNVGLEFIQETLSAFEIIITTEQILSYGIILFVAVSIILLAFNYFNIKDLKYDVYDDKIIYKETQALILVNTQEIPYQNMTRIIYARDGLLNKALNCGDITIELTGTKIPKITLVSIDNPENASAYIQRKLNEYNMKRQAQFTEQQRVNAIMRKF